MKVKDLFKKTQIFTMCLSIMCFLIGIFFKTLVTISFLSILFGIILILVGISMIYRYFEDGVIRLFYGYSLLYSVLSIMMGLIILFNQESVIYLISIFAAITLLIEFISKVQTSVILRKIKIDNWKYEAVLSLLFFAMAVMIIINPVSSILSLSKVVGSILIVFSIINIVDMFVLKTRIKNVKKSLKEVFVFEEK